jgi:hypothetical protein
VVKADGGRVVLSQNVIGECSSSQGLGISQLESEARCCKADAGPHGCRGML